MHGLQARLPQEEENAITALLSPVRPNGHALSVQGSSAAPAATLRARVVSWVLICLVVASLAFTATYTILPHKKPFNLPRIHPKEQPDLSFFIIGDWGREGSSAAARVAESMGDVANMYSPSFILSTGDNFYPQGLTSPCDPLFTKCFTQRYTADGLKVPFYAVVGNHDYGEVSDFHQVAEGVHSPYWQVSGNSQGSLAARDARWNLKQGAWRQTFAFGLLDVVFIDTVVYLMHKSTEQTKVIEDLLKSSTARFKAVVGHHPCYSWGDHCKRMRTKGDCAAMLFLAPILQKYQVDVYFAGHEHNLQLIKDENRTTGNSVLHVVSGAGAGTRKGAAKKIPPSLIENGDAWMSEAPGFVSATIKDDIMTLEFWSAPLGQWGMTQTKKLWSIDKPSSRSHSSG